MGEALMHTSACLATCSWCRRHWDPLSLENPDWRVPFRCTCGHLIEFSEIGSHITVTFLQV